MKYELIHPRKVKWIMEDFLNTACDIMSDTYTIKYENGHFVKGEEISIPCQISLVKADTFAAGCNEYPPEEPDTELIITYDGKDPSCRTYGIATSVIHELFPNVRGFARITITLLHELGHHETISSIPRDFDRDLELYVINSDSKRKNWSHRQHQLAYALMPDEYLATKWAANWLKDPEHRKIAKAFEKKFFACFKKVA